MNESKKIKKLHTVLLREYLDQEDDGGNVIAFKEAGDELVDFVARGEKYSWYEAFLRPIGFLYRHYLELELKYWIKELTEKPLDRTGRMLKQHNLKKLWLELKPLIEPFCETKEDQVILSEVEDVILTFDEYDPTGQEFRYNRTTKDAETLRNLPSRIDMQSVKCLITKVFNFFEGLSGAIGACS